MLQIAYLCAVMAETIPCMPYNDLTACETARGALVAALVEQSECAAVEIIIEHSPDYMAPETAPFPKPKGGTKA